MNYYLWSVEHGIFRSCKGYNGGCLTSKWVSLFFDSNIKGYVLELNPSWLLCNYKGVERVPLCQKCILCNFLAFLHKYARSVWHRMTLYHPTFCIKDSNCSVFGDVYPFAFSVGNKPYVVVFNSSMLFVKELALYPLRHRSTAYVEGSHGELSSGLSYRLCCNYSHSLSHIYQFPLREIPSIAHGTYTMLGFASKRRPNHYFFYSCMHYSVCEPLINYLISLGYHLSRVGVYHILCKCSTYYPVFERNLFLTTFHYSFHEDTSVCSAITLHYCYILCHVYKPSG